MPTESLAVTTTLTHWQQARSQLQHQADSGQLLQLSRQLSQYRLGQVATEPTALTLNSVLPDALWRSELLLSLSTWLNWPHATVQLLLNASYCCGLSDILSDTQSHPRLQPYPPLLSAKLLRTSAPAALLQVLDGCYATERKIPYWRQSAASLLLTLVMRFSTPNADNSFTTQLGRRIMLSRCEHELALLRTLVLWHRQTALQPPQSAATLFNHSDYQQLRHSSNKQLAACLSTTAAMREPVLKLATELNRQQQPITDVSLAVNLIGRDLLDNVLIDAELSNVLSQLHHPQHAMLQQLTAAFACSLHLQSQDNLTMAKCRALARCLCAPLWFDSSGYRSGLLRPANTPLPDFRLYQQAAASALISKLLQQYQLTDWLAAAQQMLSALQQQSAPHDETARMLLIAWHSCQAVFNSDAAPHLTAVLQQQTGNTVNSSDPQLWLTTVAGQANCQCPLLLTL